jgi:uncharacterized FlaG/YvyC family protein
MEVQFVSKAILPSTAQTSPQAVPANNAEANSASRSPLASPAQTVTVTPEVSTPEAERRQDRTGRQEEETVTAQQALDSLRLTSFRTQLDFNRELDTVVLQVVDTRTEEVIETIPPEELIRQLKEAISPQTNRFDDSNGGVVIDRSI